MKLVLPTVPSPRMHPRSPPKIAKICWQSKKSDEPDPGTYKEVLKAFKSTQNRVKTSYFGKSDRSFFTNDHTKTKEFVPGVGKYEIINPRLFYRRNKTQRQ